MIGKGSQWGLINLVCRFSYASDLIL